MSSNVAWLCQAVGSFELKSYDIVISFPEVIDAPERYKIQKLDTEESIKISQQIGAKWAKLKNELLSGNYISPEMMPTKMYREPGGKLPSANEFAFVTVGAFLIFNQACYDVLSKARLGKTHFSQVHLYDIVTQELLTEEPFYFMNYAEQRQLVNLDKSESIEPNKYYPQNFVHSAIFARTDLIKLNSEANQIDVDIWHDPYIRDSLFITDELANRLLEAGISHEDLSLLRCEIL